MYNKGQDEQIVLVEMTEVLYRLTYKVNNIINIILKKELPV